MQPRMISASVFFLHRVILGHERDNWRRVLVGRCYNVYNRLMAALMKDYVSIVFYEIISS